MSKIFISQSSKDKKIVESFVDNILRLGMNLTTNDVFCTSSEGMGIKSGEEWRNRIKAEITGADIILLIITPNYKASEICLNEMGAAWITDAIVIPLIMGEITYQSAGVIAEPRQIEKLDEYGLSHLCETIKETFPNLMEKFNLSVWESKRRKFIKELSEYLESNPFPRVYSQNEIGKEIEKLSRLQTDFDKLLDENGRLSEEIEKLKDCKDAKEVYLIEQEYKNTDILELFKERLEETKENLKKVSPVVRTVIFNNYCKKELDVNILFKEDLAKAVAQNYIECNNGVYVPIYKKRIMSNIKESLTKLTDFLTDLDVKDEEIIQQTYDIIDINDLDFWTDVIGVSMDYRT